MNNISLVMEFQRWWVLNSKLFGQESTCHQGKIFKKFLRIMTVRQKVPKSYFQSQFWMLKINWIFSKKNLSKNINLGDHYLVKTFFLNSIFVPLFFLKLRPIFDKLTLLVGVFKKHFLGGMLILGQKPYFLGPTIFEIPQPNWHY